jgi:hypothetical protein
MANARSPVCPNCGSRLPYARINIVNPFECPACGKRLCVPAEYSNNIRRVCIVLTIASYMGFFLVWKSFLLAFLLAFLVLFVVALVSAIFCKRLLPPKIQDYATESVKARYIAL